MNGRYPEPAPDFTDAFLGTLGLIFFMAFWVIAALFGYLWVAITGTALNAGITRLARIRSGR